VIMEKVKVISKSRDAAARPKVPRINLDSIKAPTTTGVGSKMDSSKRSGKTKKGMAFLESTNYNR
jgi:hypothetical protein